MILSWLGLTSRREYDNKCLQIRDLELEKQGVQEKLEESYITNQELSKEATALRDQLTEKTRECDFYKEVAHNLDSDGPIKYLDYLEGLLAQEPRPSYSVAYLVDRTPDGFVKTDVVLLPECKVSLSFRPEETYTEDHAKYVATKTTEAIVEETTNKIRQAVYHEVKTTLEGKALTE